MTFKLTRNILLAGAGVAALAVAGCSKPAPAADNSAAEAAAPANNAMAPADNSMAPANNTAS
jgi:hypothetical protein